MRVKTLLESLPQRAYSATQVLSHEAIVAKSLAIAMTDLMEQAGLAVFTQIQASYPQVASLLVLCGKGNNGGDGFVIARLAAAMSIQVTVCLSGDQAQIKGDAKVAFDKLSGTKVTIIVQSELSSVGDFLRANRFELVVDAIFGIGFTGHLPENIAQLVDGVNASQLPVISVDVPSGLSASTGHVENCAVIAQQTVTFIAVKQGLLTGQAANYCGEIFFAGLGLSENFQSTVASTVYLQGHASAEGSSLPLSPARAAACHKGTIGQLLAIGGGQGMPGAIRLASEAALRAGASLVAVCCHPDNIAMVFNGRPELMLAPLNKGQLAKLRHFQNAKLLLCGSGLGQGTWAQQLFQQTLASIKPCVLDADALRLLALMPEQRDNWVLTPHPKEAAALLNCSVAAVEQDRFAAIRQITAIYGGICVLKGAGSLICDGENIWINTTGNSGMASGGMGDVLSGIIAALLMQMTVPIDAVRLAVHLHGFAADIIANKSGKIGMLASDLFPEIQRLLNSEPTKNYD